jgi:hypothetical protein
MSVFQPFKSAGQASVALTTAAVAVATAAPIPGDGENVLIVNASGALVTCDFSTATLSATANSPYVVPIGERMLVTVGKGLPLFASAYPTATASGPVYFMRGDGSTY